MFYFFYFKGMPNLIDFFKIIFLHVILVRILVMLLDGTRIDDNEYSERLESTKKLAYNNWVHRDSHV